MEIGHQQAGAVSVLAPVGRLDTDSATDLELALQDLIGADVRHFVVDFAKIGYVSSAGLRVLLMAARQLDGGKGSLRLCGLSPQVRRVFDIAGFGKLFQIFADRDAALDRHPHVADAAPQIGRLASRLMGAKDHQADVDAADADIARRAASLLGAKPAATAAAAPASPATPGTGDRTMALKSLNTPHAPAPGAALAAGPAAPQAKGLLSRLFGWWRR
ncbi:MAG: STAS domain-containing protein [Pseudomonadota bacterium]